MNHLHYVIAALAIALAACLLLYAQQQRAFAHDWGEMDKRVKETIANPLITGISIANGSLHLGMEGIGPQLLAGMFLGMFEKHPDAKNYIECHLASSKGHVIVTARRSDGATPDFLKRQAEGKLADVSAVFLDLLRQVDEFIAEQGEASFYTGPARAMRCRLEGKVVPHDLQPGLEKLLAQHRTQGERR